MFTDARRKNHGVDAAQRRRERGDLLRDPMREQLDRFTRRRLIAAEQIAAIGAYSRDAEQSRAVIENVFDARERLSLLLQEMDDDAWVERAAARRHRDSVERRKAHARIAAFAVFERAEARAAAKVRGDDTSGCEIGRKLAQLRCHEFVGQTVKSVSLDPGIEHFTRQGEAADDVGLRPMERRVERRRLRQVGAEMPDRADQSETLRLMQRRQIDEARNRRQRVIGNQSCIGESIAAVHDAMTDRRYSLQCKVVGQPAERFIDELVQILGDFGAQWNVGNGRTFDDMQQQRRASEIDDAPAQSHRPAFGQAVKTELDGR